MVHSASNMLWDERASLHSVSVAVLSTRAANRTAVRRMLRAEKAALHAAVQSDKCICTELRHPVLQLSQSYSLSATLCQGDGCTACKIGSTGHLDHEKDNIDCKTDDMGCKSSRSKWYLWQECGC